MSNTTKLIIVNILCHVVFVYALFTLSPIYFLYGYVWWLFVFSTSISSGYHRYGSHGSFKTHKFYEWYYQFMGIFANAGPALSWCVAHRMHHVHTDTDKDPTNPNVNGYLNVFFNLWGYKFIANRKYSKDLLRNKSIQFFYKYYFAIAILTYFAILLISVKLFVVLVVSPVLFAFYGFGMVNTYNHRNGKAENKILTNILIPGEGWHKNHHEDGRNYKIGKKWYEIDLPAYFIKLIKV